MKKILSLLITFVLCLFVFAGCANPNANDSKDQNTDTEQQNEEMHVSGKDEYTEFSGIFLTIESVESSKDARGNEYRIYTLRWHNQSNKDFEYDASHTIEYRNGDTWVDKTVARIDWVLDVYTVHPNETSDIVATTQGFDTAALGIYRIRYDFKVDGNTYNSWVIFEIKENEEKDEWGGDTTHPGGTDVHDAFDIRISWANWLDGTIVDEGCLNFDQLAISSVHHIPLHKFSSRSELDAFKARFGEDNSFDYGYNGKSFNENTADYDDAFFEENDLFLVYVDANSGSFSFDVNNIFNDGKSFGIYVNQTNNPEDVTDDMAGWFITVAVPKSATENCTLFDAIMGFPPCIDSNNSQSGDNNNYVTIGTAVSDVMSSYAISCKIPQEYSTNNTDIPILLSFGLIEGCDADTDNFSEIVLRAENDDGQTVIIKRINISEILKIEYLAENVWDENREWIIGFNYTHTESIVLPLSLFAGTSGQIHIGLYECSSTDLETMKLGSGAYVVLTYTRNESSIFISVEAVR